jgi:hypothetical protein
MRQEQAVTLERLDAAIADVAQLVVVDDRYVPLLERLFSEREVLVKKQDTLSRAHAIVRQRAGQDDWSGPRTAMPRTRPNSPEIAYPAS